MLPVSPCGSKTSVLVPTQRHWPAGCGDRVTGTGSFDRSARPVSATIGWLKVTLRLAANGTSPSGAYRTTSRGPASTTGVSTATGAGKGSFTTTPGRGAGSDWAGNRKSWTSPVSPSSGGRRSRMLCASASLSGSPVASGLRSAAGGWSAPADSS